MALNDLFNIGWSALNTNQTAISVTGNNIANVNTDGYSRQSVRIESRNPVYRNFGQIGQGAEAAEIYRNFDRFLEAAYLTRSTQQSRWNEQALILNSVQSMFNEANTPGLAASLGNFFGDWSNLTLRPNDSPTRESLLAHASTLTQFFSATRTGLQNMQKEMDLYIEQGVTKVNDILKGIKELNQHIATNEADGIEASQLLDKRDSLVRELATYIDVAVTDNGGGNFTVATKAGLPLVDNQTIYPLELKAGVTEKSLQPNSKYEGSIVAEGTDAYEYTFQVVTPPRNAQQSGTVDIPGTMRVSLDGGKSWLRDENGREILYPVPTNPDERVQVKDLTVHFDADTTKMVAGDTITVSPKVGLYWVKPTREPLNITPQTFMDGTENGGRLTGGKLAAYFDVRDDKIGSYIDKLDALANSLIWEVNSAHSQGTGNKKMTYTVGSYEVRDTTLPLGRSGTGLPYSDRLTKGNMSIWMYKPDGTPDEEIVLDFDPTLDNGVQNFDPSIHNLEDVANAINRSGTPNANGKHKLTATIMNGRLQLNTTDPGTSFSMGTDSTGLLATLGINTFFTGSNAGSIALKEDVVQDINYINAGKVGVDGLVKEGDNTTAKAISELVSKAVKISTTWEHSKQPLSSYYAGTVALVGAEARTAKYNNAYNTALTKDLDEQCASVSGVNLDEEMTNLIKFQHSYTAAAKLITTADEMLQTLLGLKQ